MSGLSLSGKCAIITGASRGIGEAIARDYVAAGATVALAARGLEGVQRVADDLCRLHGAGRAYAFAAHTGREAACRELVASAVGEMGRVDILVNNAATNPQFGPLMDATEAAWDKTFVVNLKGYFWMAREVALHLRQRNAEGSLISVSSVVARLAAPMQGVYGMTKAAVESMTRTLAVELGSSNIRVNAIAPGLVETQFASALVSNDTIRNTIVGRTPLGRVGVPADIAGAAVFLGSDAARFMTGQTIVVDGGMTVG